MRLPEPFITLQLPLLHLTTITALALGPSHQVLRLGLTLPLFVLLVLQSLYREWGGTWGHHYAIECMVMTCVWVYFDWNILGSPDREGWRKVHNDEDGEKKKAGNGKVPEQFWARFSWGVRLGMGSRYVGWSCEVKNVPREGGSRWGFVARKTLRAVLFFVLRDAIYAYTAASPYGTWDDIKHIKPIARLSEQPYPTRWYYAWVHIFLTYIALEQAMAAYGAVSVATGLAKPRDCPSAFGDLRGLVTVRKAWSSVWHQNCRRICSAPGIFIARDVLHLERGSFASKYLQLFVGFGISAIVHGCSAMFVHGSLEDDAAFIFFLGQAVIIFIEDHLINLGKKLGFKNSAFWRIMGFVWTVLAVGAGTEPWSAKAIGHGIWIHGRTLDVFRIGPQIVA